MSPMIYRMILRLTAPEEYADRYGECDDDNATE